MSAITFEMLKDADPSDLDMYRRVLNGAFPEGLEPWTQEMGEVLHLISALPIGTATGRLPGSCYSWIASSGAECELNAVGGRYVLFKREVRKHTIKYEPLQGFVSKTLAMAVGKATWEKEDEKKLARGGGYDVEEHVAALEKRVDRLTATVDSLKDRFNARSAPAAPWDFPASDVRAGMAPAGFTVATTPPAAEPPAPVPWDGILWGQIRDWSKATFGPGRRTKGLLEHIRRELDEVAAAPDDLVEWVDVVLLAYDGYWRHGGTPEGFLDMVRYKFKVNQARKWPPPAPDDQPNHHVKEEDWHHDPDDDAHGTPAEHPAPPAQPEGHNAPCAFCGVFSKNHCEGGCLRGDECCGHFQEKLKGPWCWLCNEHHATAEHTRTTGLQDPCAGCGTLREHHCGGGECLYGKCCGRFEEASK